MNLKRVVFLCCAVALTTCAVTFICTSEYVNNQKAGSEIRLSEENYDSINELLNVADLEELIDEYYYQEVSQEQLLNGALKGIVSALDDPYSVYYTEDEYKEYNERNDGTFVGIGATVSTDEETGYLRVVDMVEEGPAQKAGVQEQDLITKIDYIDVREMPSDEIADMLKGPVGSPVMVTVINAAGEEESFQIIREELQHQYVFYTMLDEDICHIVISEFHGDVSSMFEDALEYAHEENAKGVILDVRNNLGGSVRECVEIADLFLPEGVVAYTLDKDGARTDYTVDADYDEIPMVMLVNGASASASEILAAAVQDGARGQIIGTQTYGKGVVQTILDMPYSGGGVKLTSAVYYSPLGRTINGIGVTPDIEVDLPADVLSGETPLSMETDSQLAMAMDVLRQQTGG